MVTPEPVIAPSAWKHGVQDDDMLHAYRNATDAWHLDDGRVMLVGPHRSGGLLARSAWFAPKTARP